MSEDMITGVLERLSKSWNKTLPKGWKIEAVSQRVEEDLSMDGRSDITIPAVRKNWSRAIAMVQITIAGMYHNTILDGWKDAGDHSMAGVNENTLPEGRKHEEENERKSIRE